MNPIVTNESAEQPVSVLRREATAARRAATASATDHRRHRRLRLRRRRTSR